MKIYPLALIAGLLPLITIHLCYLVAVQANHVSACVPYFHSCTSISAAGREGVEYYLFKGLMIPSAVFFIVFWAYACQWLRALGAKQQALLVTIVGFGCIASFGLILYSLVLGAIGPEFRLQRRIGVITFFSLSFVAQLLFLLVLNSIAKRIGSLRAHLLGIKVCHGIILCFAVSAVIISNINSTVYDSMEDAFEWWVTLVLCLFPLIVAMMWRRTGYLLKLSVCVE